MLSFYSVHAPIQCSENRWKKYQAKAEAMGLTKRSEPRFEIDRSKEVRQVQDHPVYAGMMAALDDAVGVVLDAIEDAGIANNTVVIFTSDNGGVSSGDGFATACLPMRGGKGRQWEGGIRQPYYIAWPGVTNEGGISEVPATGTDFYPTILDMAGLDGKPEQHLDGVSLVPALKGESVDARDLFWHYPHYGNQGGDPSAIILRGDWKLIHYFEDGRYELYNIARNTGETNDLAAERSSKVTEMATALKTWQKEVGASFPTEKPNYSAENHQQSMQQLKKVGLPRRESQHAEFLNPDFIPKGGWWDQRGK